MAGEPASETDAFLVTVLPLEAPTSFVGPRPFQCCTVLDTRKCDPAIIQHDARDMLSAGLGESIYFAVFRRTDSMPFNTMQYERVRSLGAVLPKIT